MHYWVRVFVLVFDCPGLMTASQSFVHTLDLKTLV